MKSWMKFRSFEMIKDKCER